MQRAESGAEHAEAPPAASERHAQRLDQLIDRLPGRRVRRAVHWLRRPAARPVRLIAGPLLIAGGLLGPLPLLGFWMLPLGVILLAEDVPPLRKAAHRALDWIERRRPHWLGTKS